MSWMSFLRLVRARWAFLLLLYVAIVAAAVGASLLLPRKYDGQAQVVVDIRPDPVAGVVLPGLLAPGLLVTQVDIITSQRIGLMVVDRLGLTRDPEAVRLFREDTGGEGSIRQYFAEKLRDNLWVEPSRESSVLTITFRATDPGFAALVANTFAQAYVDTSVAMKVEPASQQRTWFETQADAGRKRVDEAQRALGDFQRSHDIVSADERLDVETARLQELSTQLSLIQVQATEARERDDLTRRLLGSGRINELPEVLANPLIQQLKIAIAQLESRLQERRAVLGASHPDIARLSEELGTLNERVRVEVQTVADSQGRTSALLRSRLADQRAAVERQRKRVLGIKGTRDQLTVLERDLENAQTSFDAIAQRLTQTRLESEASQTNLFLLTRAEPPNEPASPKPIVVAIVALVAGAALAIGILLVSELLRRRVRSPHDLAEAIRAPLLGVIREQPASMFKPTA